MRRILVLAFVLVASTVHGAEQLVFSHLPEDVKEPMRRAVELSFKEGGDSSLKAEWTLRLMEVPEEQIREKAKAQINALLEEGRKAKLSRPVPFVLHWESLLKSPAGTPLHEGDDLYERYSLASVYKMLRENGIGYDALENCVHYVSDIKSAFDLALAAGDDGLAREAYFHALRLGRFEDSALMAKKLGYDNDLLNIGLQGMSFFFYQDFGTGKYNPNWITQGIDALGLIQSGEHKKFADAMLFDIAHFFAVQNYKYWKISLKALIATGLSQPEHIAYAQQLIDQLAKDHSSETLHEAFHEVFSALKKIGDKPRLTMLGQKLVAETTSAPEELEGFSLDRAFEIFTAAENKKEIKALLKLEKKSVPAIAKSEMRGLRYILEDLAAAQDVKGAKGVLAYLRKNQPVKLKSTEGVNWDSMVELAQSIVDGKYQVETPGPDRNSHEGFLEVLATSEKYIRDELEKSKALTSDQRKALVAEGQLLVQDGQLWKAYLKYVGAYDRKRLLALADLCLEKGEALSAIAALEAASLLPQDI